MNTITRRATATCILSIAFGCSDETLIPDTVESLPTSVSSIPWRGSWANLLQVSRSGHLVLGMNSSGHDQVFDQAGNSVHVFEGRAYRKLLGDGAVVQIRGTNVLVFRSSWETPDLSFEIEPNEGESSGRRMVSDNGNVLVTAEHICAKRAGLFPIWTTRIKAYDLSMGDKILEFPISGLLNPIFLPSSEYLAYAYARFTELGILQINSLPHQEITFKIGWSRLSRYFFFAGDVGVIRLSKNNQFIATNSYDSKLKVFDIRRGVRVKAVGGGPDLQDLEFSPDGRYLLALSRTSPTILSLWRTDNWQRRVFRGEFRRRAGINFILDGRVVLGTGARLGVYRLDDFFPELAMTEAKTLPDTIW